MKEINLIVSQETLKQNRERELKKDKIKMLMKATDINYKKQYDLSKVCLYSVIALIMVLIFAWVLHFSFDLKQKGIQGC